MRGNSYSHIQLNSQFLSICFVLQKFIETLKGLLLYKQPVLLSSECKETSIGTNT